MQSQTVQSIVIPLLAMLLAATARELPGAPPLKLTLVVVEGEGAINNIKRRTSREAIVQVEDENRKPVAGAAVAFLLPADGPGGTFTGGAKSASIVTDSAGRAAMPHLQVNSNPGILQHRGVCLPRGTGVKRHHLAIQHRGSGRRRFHRGHHRYRCWGGCGQRSSPRGCVEGERHQLEPITTGRCADRIGLHRRWNGFRPASLSWRLVAHGLPTRLSQSRLGIRGWLVAPFAGDHPQSDPPQVFDVFGWVGRNQEQIGAPFRLNGSPVLPLMEGYGPVARSGHNGVQRG